MTLSQSTVFNLGLYESTIVPFEFSPDKTSSKIEQMSNGKNQILNQSPPTSDSSKSETRGGESASQKNNDKKREIKPTPAKGKIPQEKMVFDDPIVQEMYDEGLLGSYQKFLEELLGNNRDEENAAEDLDPSSVCQSDFTDTFSIFRGLCDEYKDFNFDTFTDPNGKRINFIELFIIRHKQLKKGVSLDQGNKQLSDLCWKLNDFHKNNPKKHTKKFKHDKILKPRSDK